MLIAPVRVGGGSSLKHAIREYALRVATHRAVLQSPGFRVPRLPLFLEENTREDGFARRYRHIVTGVVCTIKYRLTGSEDAGQLTLLLLHSSARNGILALK